MWNKNDPSSLSMLMFGCSVELWTSMFDIQWKLLECQLELSQEEHSKLVMLKVIFSNWNLSLLSILSSSSVYPFFDSAQNPGFKASSGASCSNSIFIINWFRIVSPLVGKTHQLIFHLFSMKCKLIQVDALTYGALHTSAYLSYLQ